MADAGRQYAKASHSDTKGEMYEVKMVALLFLRAVVSGLAFEMGSNVAGAGALDDVVLRFKPKDSADQWTTLFVQLKHKLRGHLSHQVLNSASANFSIYKYFKSYLVINDKSDNDRTLIDGPAGYRFCTIFTNAPFQTEAIMQEAKNDLSPLNRQLRADNKKEQANIVFFEALNYLVKAYKSEQEQEKSNIHITMLNFMIRLLKLFANNVLSVSNYFIAFKHYILSDDSGDSSKHNVETGASTAASPSAAIDDGQLADSRLQESFAGRSRAAAMCPQLLGCDKGGVVEYGTFGGQGGGSERAKRAVDPAAVEGETNKEDGDDAEKNNQDNGKELSTIESDAPNAEATSPETMPSSAADGQWSELVGADFEYEQVKERPPGKRDAKEKKDARRNQAKQKEESYDMKAKRIMAAMSEENLQDEMKTFLGQLLVFHDQPDVNELDEVIKVELRKLLKTDFSYGFNFEYVFTNYIDIMVAFCESDKVLDNNSTIVLEAWNKTVTDLRSSGDELLNRYRIQFADLNFLQEERLKICWNEINKMKPSLLLQSSEDSCRLSVTKILQAVEDEYLFFGIKTVSDPEIQVSFLPEWLKGERKTLVIVWNQPEMPANKKNCAIFAKLFDYPRNSGKRIIVVASEIHAQNLFKLCFEHCQENDCALIKDEFKFENLTVESQEKIKQTPFRLEHHETSVDRLYPNAEGAMVCMELLTASAVVEILDDARASLAASASPEEVVYIDRRLERPVVNAGILVDPSPHDCLLVLDSTMPDIQRVLPLADPSLTASEAEEALHKFCDPNISHFRVGTFEGNFVANEHGDYLALRSGSGRIVFVFKGFDINNLSLLCVCHSTKLRFECGEMTWVKLFHSALAEGSSSPVSPAGDRTRIIRAHLDESKTTSLSPKTLVDVEDRLVVLCAEPGMGKSTLIGHLVRETRRSHPSHLVVSVPLNHHDHLLANAEFADAGAFLSASAGMTQFQRSMLERALQGAVNVVVVFDGFDEVARTYARECCSLLTKLLKTNVFKVWVTSRLTTEETLENEMQTVSIRLRPFDLKDREKFFKLFFAHRGVENKSIDYFVKYVLEKENTAISEREQELMDIPLQTRIMADLSVDYLSPVEGLSTEESWKRMEEKFKKMDLLFLLEEYIKMKRKFYIEEKLKTKRSNAYYPDFESLCSEYNKQHQHFAVLEHFEKDFQTFDLKLNTNTETQMYIRIQHRGDDCTGIIDGIIKCKPNFVHRVYSEYFVAEWISENIGKNTELLVKNLYADGFVVIRGILDKILAKYGDNLKLHRSILNEDVEEFKRLLKVEGGDSINAIDLGGRTPLHLVAALGSAKDRPRVNEKRVGMLDALVGRTTQLGLSLDVGREDALLRRSALQYASLARSWVATDRLLRHVERPTLVIEPGDHRDTASLLHCVAANDLHALLGLCLDPMATIRNKLRDAIDWDMLREALKRKHLRVAKLLAENVSSDKVGETAATDVFHVALSNRSADVAIALINKGVDIDNSSTALDGCRPLMFATRSGQDEVVGALLSRVGEGRRYDYANRSDAEGYAPIHRAAENGNLPLVTLLFDAGSEIDRNELDTALMAAAERGHVHVMAFLLDKVPDSARKLLYVNKRGADGLTALARALGKGHEEAARLLVDHGADLNRGKTQNRRTVLHDAVADKKEGAIQGILDFVPYAENSRSAKKVRTVGNTVVKRSSTKEASRHEDANVRFINQIDNDGNTAVHVAFSLNCLRIMRMLVKAGGSLSQVSKGGQTLLMVAAEDEEVGRVKRLLEIISEESVDGSKLMANLFKARDDEGCTVLHHAVLKGNVQVVKSLMKLAKETLASGGSGELVKFVNVCDNAGDTALHMAATKINPIVMKILIDAGADVDRENNAKRTPLIAASGECHPHIVQTLVQKSKLAARDYVNKGDQDGMTPLHYACGKGSQQVVGYLIANGADVFLEDARGRTSLHLAEDRGRDVLAYTLIGAARKAGDARTLRFILKADNQGLTALDMAVIKGQWKTIECLMSQGGIVKLQDGSSEYNIPDCNPSMDAVIYLIKQGVRVLEGGAPIAAKPLRYAAQRGDVSTVTAILQLVDSTARGALVDQVDELGNTALLMAAERDDAALVKTLVEAGGDLDAVNAGGETALMKAAGRGHLHVVRYLCDVNATSIDLADLEGKTALHHAAISGKRAVIQHLKKKNANVQRCDAQQRTPFHYAALGSDSSVVEELLSGLEVAERKRTVNAVDREGNAAIHLAARSGTSEIAQLLYSEGQDLKLPNSLGLTPLMLAVQSGNQEMTKWLIATLSLGRTSPDQHVWAQDNSKMTLLHHAAKQGNTEIIELILKNKMKDGAVDTRDEFRNTALHLAARGWSLEAVRSLLGAGADVAATNSAGETALMCACFCGLLRVVQAIVRCVEADDVTGRRPVPAQGRGEYVRVRNNEGRSAVDLAREQNLEDVEAFLLEQAGIWTGRTD